MKRTTRVKTLFLVVVGLLLSSAPHAMAQQQGPPVISVSSHGEVKVVPDRAEIQISVRSRALSAAQAASDNAARQTRVIAALRMLASSEMQISTEGYSVTPETRIDKADNAPRVVSYLVTNSLLVDLSNTSLIGSVLDTAIASGANEISSVSLYSSNTESAYQKALGLATKNARMEASSIAEAAGGHLGALLEIASSGANWPSPMVRSSRLMGAMAVETPVLPGQESVTASVTARWVFIANQ